LSSGATKVFLLIGSVSTSANGNGKLKGFLADRVSRAGVMMGDAI